MWEACDRIPLVFCRFDMQGTTFLGTRCLEVDSSFLGMAWIRGELVPINVSSIPEAHRNLEDLALNLLHLLPRMNASKEFWAQ
jgi:hypothetical protein